MPKRKSNHSILSQIPKGSVIPAPRNHESFKKALKKSQSPVVILLFGDINLLPELLKEAEKYKKKLVVHFDLLHGIGKDKEGLIFLKQMGVQCIVTTKSTITKHAMDEGFEVIQRLFVVDSESIKTGIQFLKKQKPGALEILPAGIPRHAIEKLKAEIKIPIFGGGLICSQENVDFAIGNGLYAVSTSDEGLW